MLRQDYVVKCEACGQHNKLPPGAITGIPLGALASYMLTLTLKEILALQTILAEQGICLTLTTAEVFSVDQPSLGK